MLYTTDFVVSASASTVTLQNAAITADEITVHVIGILQHSNFVPSAGGAFTGNVTFGDNIKTIYGAGSDLQIYHDGSDSIIKDAGTGNLRIGADTDIVLGNAALTEVKAAFTSDGAASLYYDNSSKIQTTATGVNVDGAATVTGDLTVDTSTLKIDSANNRVGVGIASPATKLHIYDSADHARLSLQCADSNGRHWQFQARNDGVLWLRDDTAGANRMVFDSSGNVGIGTNSPTSDGGTTLEIYNASTPTLRLNDGGDYKSLFQLRGNDTEIRGSSGNMEFYTGNVDGASSTERMRIASAGDVTVNSGNVVIGTAGKGIDFSNATDHTTGESSVGSVLDDYEEGTWQPTFNNSGSATVTFAKYRKVGNMVTVWARLVDLNCPSYSATVFTIDAPVATLQNEEYASGSIMAQKINISGIITLSPYVYNNKIYFYYTIDNANNWGELKWNHFNGSGETDILFFTTYPCQ